MVFYIRAHIIRAHYIMARSRLGAQHAAERALQQHACGEAAAGAAGFARRAAEAENLTAVPAAAAASVCAPSCQLMVRYI